MLEPVDGVLVDSGGVVVFFSAFGFESNIHPNAGGVAASQHLEFLNGANAFSAMGFDLFIGESFFDVENTHDEHKKRHERYDDYHERGHPVCHSEIVLIIFGI